jgi:hypothetical protein
MEQDVKKKSKEKINKFDEYKFFAESTQHLSERRQSATQTYLSINTAIVGVLTFLIKDSGIAEERVLLVIVPLFLVGILACWIWYKIIVQYKKLINWRYDQLMEMEHQFDNCHQIYINEKEKFFKFTKGKRKFGFSRLERVLPIMFIVLYVLYSAGFIIYTIAY